LLNKKRKEIITFLLSDSKKIFSSKPGFSKFFQF